MERLEQLTKTSISLLHTNMKRILTIAIGSSFFLVAGLSLAFTFGSPNYVALIQDEMEQSSTHTKQAKAISCEYIGTLMSGCFARKTYACDKLKTAVSQYELDFSSNPKTDCEAQEAPVETAQADKPNDQLFFGDEELN